MPWVVLLVLGVLVVWTFLLGRTRFGRYVYAIGGNAEAARRAGVNLADDPDDRVHAVPLHGGHRGHRLRVAAAVDLDATRRRHARAVRGRRRGDRRHEPVRRPREGDRTRVLGGIVIAAIDNGMGLLGFSAASKYMVTALVLLAAVTIDALSRRGRVEA